MEEERKRREEEEKKRKEEEEQERLRQEMKKLEEEQKLFEEEMRKYEEEKRKYEEEQRRIEMQRIIAEERQRVLDEEEHAKLTRRFIYDEDKTIYKNTTTKTFYTEYIQKTYTNTTEMAFPTRNTKTKVFGSDENDDYVYNTANTSFNSNTNININNVMVGNVCAQCAALQSANATNVIGAENSSSCPGCGRMLKENIASQIVTSEQQNISSNVQNIQNVQNVQKMQSVQNVQSLTCPTCQMNEMKAKMNLNSVGQNQIVTEQNLVQVHNSICPGCGRMTNEHF